jgi:hypothetical protein
MGAMVVMTAVISGLLGVVPAAAESPHLAVRDGRHDVVREPRGCSDTGCAPTEQGRNKPGADVVRLRADYASDLTLSVKVRGVARRAFYVWRVRAAGRDVFPAVVKRRGTVTVRFFDRQGEPAPCDGLTGGLDPQTRVASVVVPPACFGSPEHVRVGAQVIVLDKAYLFVDDAQRDQMTFRGIDRAKLSDRIDRSPGGAAERRRPT